MGRGRDREREGRAHEGHMGRARATEREREGEKSQESDTHAHRPNEKERCRGHQPCQSARSRGPHAMPRSPPGFSSRQLQWRHSSPHAARVPRACPERGMGVDGDRGGQREMPPFSAPVSLGQHHARQTTHHRHLRRHLPTISSTARPHGNSRPHAHAHRTAHTQEMCHGSHHAPRAPATST